MKNSILILLILLSYLGCKKEKVCSEFAEDLVVGNTFKITKIVNVQNENNDITSIILNKNPCIEFPLSFESNSILFSYTSTICPEESYEKWSIEKNQNGEIILNIDNNECKVLTFDCNSFTLLQEVDSSNISLYTKITYTKQ